MLSLVFYILNHIFRASHLLDVDRHQFSGLANIESNTFIFVFDYFDLRGAQKIKSNALN